MRRYVLGTVMAIAVVLGILLRGQLTEAQSPTLVGTWDVASIKGGQPTMLLMLNSDGTAMTTDTRGKVHLGAWAVSGDDTFGINMHTLEDSGGAQGFLINAPVIEEPNGKITLGELRLTRVTPPTTD